MTGIILSGGKSLRMGRNKALIQIQGIPLIERVYNTFHNLFQETLIITDQKDLFSHLGAGIHNDLPPYHGALGGLYTGLFFSSFSHAFCVACDMPFLKESLIRFLIKQINGYDVVVPRTSDGLQPLHAIYSKSCLDPIRQILEHENQKILDFYPMVSVRVVEEKEFRALDPRNESFININTPEELLVAQGKKTA